jgi:hypothetical protein
MKESWFVDAGCECGGDSTKIFHEVFFDCDKFFSDSVTA